MKNSSDKGRKNPISTKTIIVGGLLAALLYASQIAMAALPNIEAVSLLIILFTIHFPRTIPLILPVFILLEGLTFGFGIWWVNYLYVWPLLALGAHLMRRNNSLLIWAIYSGVFGLCFGALCAIPWAISGGWAAGVAYWVRGIPFDIAHCAGNIAMMLVLYKPLSRPLRWLANYSEGAPKTQ